MDQDSSAIERHVDALSRVNWSELLIGPCHVVRSYSFDGRVEYLRLRSLTAVLTFEVVPGTLPRPLVELFDTALRDQSITELSGEEDEH